MSTAGARLIAEIPWFYLGITFVILVAIHGMLKLSFGRAGRNVAASILGGSTTFNNTLDL